MAIVMTSQEFVTRLKYMATKRKSTYKNSFPYNCCYIYGDGSISADCIGLVKSLINNPNVYNKMGPAGFYVTPGINIPDTTEAGILNLADAVSSDFKSIAPGEYLYMSGHAGVFCGDFQDKSGTVNTVECTPAFGGGITTSFTDEQGRRFNHKGGTQLGKWEKHGKLSRYIKYIAPADNRRWVKKWFMFDGEKPVTGWQKWKYKWYYLDPITGEMVTGWNKLAWSKGTDWFYFDPESGAMVTGWKKLSGKWYYLDPSTGAMYTGKHTIEGKTYNFDKNGALIE